MEGIRQKLSILLAKRGYLESDYQKAGESQMTIVFTTNRNIESGEIIEEKITVKVVDIPYCKELMVYVKADHLLRRIVTMKISAQAQAQRQTTLATQGIILALFPPLTSCPALSHLPDICVDFICGFLEVKTVLDFFFMYRH